jgi:hypothetical protein
MSGAFVEKAPESSSLAPSWHALHRDAGQCSIDENRERFAKSSWQKYGLLSAILLIEVRESYSKLYN